MKTNNRIKKIGVETRSSEAKKKKHREILPTTSIRELMVIRKNRQVLANISTEQ